MSKIMKPSKIRRGNSGNTGSKVNSKDQKDLLKKFEDNEDKKDELTCMRKESDNFSTISFTCPIATFEFSLPKAPAGPLVTPYINF